VGRR
jgi:hypothetical protein